MDAIETMRCMLRDPIWWREESGWDAVQSSNIYNSPIFIPEPPITTEAMDRMNVYVQPIPKLLKRFLTEVAASGFGPTCSGFEGGWFDSHGTFILGAKIPPDWQRVEVQPGLTVWLQEIADDDDEAKLQMYPSEWLHLANDGCQTNWYVYCNGEEFPVIYEEEADVHYWNGKPIPFETFEDRISLFGGIVAAPTFDGWVTDWIYDFQNKYQRWYDHPKVLSELFPEPMYLKRGKDGYHLVTADEW